MKKLISKSAVRESFVQARGRSVSPGHKAGRAVQAGAITAAATVVAGAGIAYGAVSGFFKGLVS